MKSVEGSVGLFDLIRQLPIPCCIVDSNVADQIPDAIRITTEAIETELGRVVAIIQEGDSIRLNQVCAELGCRQARFVLNWRTLLPKELCRSQLPPFGSWIGWKTMIDIRATFFRQWLIPTAQETVVLDVEAFTNHESAAVAPISYTMRPTKVLTAKSGHKM